MNSSHIVIIGGGISGISCAQTLAQECPQNTITLISASDLLKVASNVKSKGINLEEFDVIQETQEFFEDNYPNIKVILDLVVELDAQAHRVCLSKNGYIGYDKLCICSGGEPKLILNECPNYVLGIRDTNTVMELQSRIKNSNRVVVIGNGGIATELVHTIQYCQVIWAIKDESFGATFFDSGAAAFFSSKLKSVKQQEKVTKRLRYTASTMSNTLQTALGIALGPDWDFAFEIKGDNNSDKEVLIEYKCEVVKFHRREELPSDKYHAICLDQQPKSLKDLTWPVYVELTSGKVYGCDFIVSATGVNPNIKPFLNNNKFDLGSDGGLLINDEMLTSEPDVYAAGDVATAGWDWAFQWFQMRLWTQARQMGIYAAYCIQSHLNTQNPKIYFPFEMFTHVTRFFGYKVILLGLFNGQKLNNDYEINLRVDKEEYIKVLLKDDKMVGAILIGETDLEETFENLIFNQINLQSIKEDLLNPNVDLEDYFD